MRSPTLLSLAGVLVLAACTPPVPPPASAYRAAAQLPPMAILFAPGSDDPSPTEAAQLGALRWVLPAGALPELFIAGPRSLPRAWAVRRLLDRPIVVRPAEPEPARPDAAVLAVPAQGSVIADACLGPGRPVIGDLWPGDDARRARLLPAGCAVATALQNQVAAHAGEADLLRGRPLPPGAAMPFTDAIERYYRRNEPGQRASPAGPSGSSGAGREGGGAAAGTGAPPQPAAETDGANPLLGPLPRAPSQPAPAPPSSAAP